MRRFLKIKIKVWFYLIAALAAVTTTASHPIQISSTPGSPQRNPANTPASHVAQVCENVADFVMMLDFHFIQANGAPQPHSGRIRSVREFILLPNDLREADVGTLTYRAFEHAGGDAASHLYGTQADTVWAMMESSRLETLKAGHEINQRFALGMVRSHGLSPDLGLRALLEDLAQNGPAPLNGDYESLLSWISDDSENDSTRLAAKLGASILCEPYGASECASAFRSILDHMPFGHFLGAKVGMPQLVTQFLQDPRNSKGAALAALKIMDRIRTAETGGKVEGHLFDDIHQAYLSAGENEEGATQRTWDLLAFYSQQGAAIQWFKELFDKKTAATGAALYVIASGMNYLDGFTRSSGHPYSLPPEVLTSCVYGKPYHFWQAAFLAHQETKSGKFWRAASAAAHLAGLGYDYEKMSSKTFDKDDSENLFTQSIRLNIAFNAAGSVFGARAGSSLPQLPLPVDAAIQTQIDHWQSSKTSNFLSWRTSFGADQAWFRFLHP